jgi:hypothetical protein
MLANFLHPVGCKDTDADREGIIFKPFFIYYKNHYLRLCRSSRPLDCKKVTKIDWQRVAEEMNEKGYAMGVTILKDAK